MSVVGVDLGALNTVIAVARNRGVDVVSTNSFLRRSFSSPPLMAGSDEIIDRKDLELTFSLSNPKITNEVSNRATPLVYLPSFLLTFISSPPHSRFRLGDSL